MLAWMTSSSVLAASCIQEIHGFELLQSKYGNPQGLRIAAVQACSGKIEALFELSGVTLSWLSGKKPQQAYFKKGLFSKSRGIVLLEDEYGPPSGFRRLSVSAWVDLNLLNVRMQSQ